jgi:hypothetical protein
MRVTWWLLPLTIGCVEAAEDPPSGDPMPASSGSFAGSYRVPTSPELEAAAIFEVDHIDWTVAGGVATLHYELPVGLVGGELEVTLQGPISDGDVEVQLTGAQGTGTCTADGTVVSCHEVFADLGELPMSEDVVAARAQIELGGAITERLQVSHLFGEDPIGIAIFDVAIPAEHD